MKKFSFLSCAFLFLTVTFTYAQLWTATFNGTANAADAITDMVVDANGNTYITGYAGNMGTGNDFVTIKYNTNGAQQWIATYNGPGNGDDIPNKLFVDGNGYIYVTGYSDSLPGSFINNDATTIKYSPDGNMIWVKRYDGTIQRNDAGNDVEVDAAGNVYITGYKTVSHSGISRKDYLTIKYNSSGSLQWTATFNGAANEDDEAIGLGLDGAGNIYVSGTTFAGNDPVGEEDYFTIKYDGVGNTIWTARYNGPASEPDRVTDIAVDESGNTYVTGYSQGNDLDWATVKYNSAGVRQWVKKHDGTAHNADIAYALVLDNAGNVIVTGSDQQNDNDSEFRTIKYNSAGVIQWSKGYDPTFLDLDEAQAVAVDASGNVYVTGYIHGVSPSRDIATIKYSDAGLKLWLKKFDGTGHGNDSGSSIGVDASGNVYVSGYTTSTQNNQNFITLKYSPNGLLKEGNEMEVPASFLSQNYPNPFSVTTTIEYYLSSQSDVTILLTDLAGRRVSEMKMSDVTSGNHSLELSSDGLPPGCYFYTLMAGDFSETKTMAVVK